MNIHNKQLFLELHNDNRLLLYDDKLYQIDWPRVEQLITVGNQIFWKTEKENIFFTDLNRQLPTFISLEDFYVAVKTWKKNILDFPINFPLL